MCKNLYTMLRALDPLLNGINDSVMKAIEKQKKIIANICFNSLRIRVGREVCEFWVLQSSCSMNEWHLLHRQTLQWKCDDNVINIIINAIRVGMAKLLKQNVERGCHIFSSKWHERLHRWRRVINRNFYRHNFRSLFKFAISFFSSLVNLLTTKQPQPRMNFSNIAPHICI